MQCDLDSQSGGTHMPDWYLVEKIILYLVICVCIYNKQVLMHHFGRCSIYDLWICILMKLAHILNVVRSTQDFVSVVPNYAETCRFTNAIYTTSSKNENMR